LAFTPAELNELPGVISAPRFATYLQARGNDRAHALALYEWNLTISAAFIVPLQVCEVASCHAASLLRRPSQTVRNIPALGASHSYQSTAITAA
jgi:hypothetical protein